MALTGLYSINGETSALEDKGLRDFISTASGSWTGGGGGGGGSGPVTSTGGTTTYINKLNNMNLSASVAYASPNGAVLDNVYNSGRSGYAASAYLVNNVTGNVGNWNAARNWVTSNSANVMTNYGYYDSLNSPNFWQYSANNVYGLKINSGNFSNLTVSNAKIGCYTDPQGRAWFDLYFWFDKFVPKTATATYTTTQYNFFMFGACNIAAPFTAGVVSVYGATFGCIQSNTLNGQGADLMIWNPYSGYTAQEMVVTAHINIKL